MSHEVTGYGSLWMDESELMFRLGFVPGWPVAHFSSEDFGVRSIANAICPEDPNDPSNQLTFTVSHTQEAESGLITHQFEFIPELMRVVWEGFWAVPTLEELQGVPGQGKVREPKRYVRGRLSHSQARNTDPHPVDQIHLLLNPDSYQVIDSTFQIVPYQLHRSPDEGLFHVMETTSPVKPVPTPNR